MKRLVESWIEAEKQYHQNSLGAAIANLNESRGMRVTYSRVSEWRRGVYVPSQLVLSHMLFRVLPWVLMDSKVPASDEQVDRIKSKLWAHVVDGQESYWELL